MIKFAHVNLNEMFRAAITTKLKASGRKQKEVCQTLGLHVSNFNAYLSGSRSLPLRDLVRVMVELKLSVGAKSQPMAVMPATMMEDVVRDAVWQSGMPMKEVSAKSGIDNSVLSSFMNGSRSMAVKHLETLMEMFNLVVLNAA